VIHNTHKPADAPAYLLNL